MITQIQLENKVQQFSQEFWGISCNLPIIINGRLKNKLGRYHWRKNGNKVTPLRLEFSRNFLEKYNEETIDGVVKHELTHWALSIQGQPFKDGHPVFERELKRVGAPSTGVIPFIGEMHEGMCSKCSKVIVRQKTYGYLRKYFTNYTSNCCKASIVYKGIREYTDESVSAPIQKKEIKTEEKTAAITTAPSHINNIVQPGPRGVTNKQMIPAMREAIDANSKERLELLKKHYPKVFEGTIRYIGKSYNERFIQLMGN